MSIVIILNYIIIVWTMYKTTQISTTTIENKIDFLKIIVFLLSVSALNNISGDLQQINKTLQQIVAIKHA